ncbi:ANTAR domain-containing protein [Nocardia sp. ET3-3]|uniref:ANTAR domain-containing protein n=1 Tax=Nocardia terrae TaxID=2675851 RepID=A0A7K1UWV9_9NOCA|nr:ANTAR domain-containing protein [Nocardia terrae]MVU78782.1 ANTAR domain-containing protein [Nocardia terrae]
MSRDADGRLDLAVGLAELTSRVLSAENVEAAARDAAAVVSRILPGEPQVGVVVNWVSDRTVFVATGSSDRLREQTFEEGPAVHHEPLRTPTGSVGTLLVRPARPGGLDERARPLVVLTADHLATLLSFRIDLAAREAHTEDLRHTLASRSAVDQAVGILMERRRFGREDALDALRTIARDRGADTTTVAAELIRRLTGAAVGTTHFDEPTGTDANRGHV